MIQVAVAVERYGRNAFGGSALGSQFAHEGGYFALVLAGGGFRHLMADKTVDGMATEQGYYALAAYYRFANGQTRLYDMTDVTVQTGGSNTPATGDTGVLGWIISLPVTILAAAFVLKRKEREA